MAALLERCADRLPPSEASALRHRRADILVDHLDALDQAAQQLEELAAEGDRGALLKLEQIYRRAERYDDYLQILRRLADAAGSQPERITALRRLAAEAEALPDGTEQAVDALDEILRLDRATVSPSRRSPDSVARRGASRRWPRRSPAGWR